MKRGKKMKKAGTPSFVSLILIISILLTPLVNGQRKTAAQRNLPSAPTQHEESGFENSYYVEDLSTAALEGRIRFTEGLDAEVEKVEKALAAKTRDKKGTIIVDKYGSKRFAVLDNLALEITRENVSSNLRGKRLLKVNLAQIVAGAEREAEIDARLETVFASIEKVKSGVIVFIEDVASFSQNNPLFGAQTAGKLRQFLSDGKIQFVSTGTVENYNTEVLADNLLKKRFAKIDLNDENSEDSFVGDKISPDLREILAKEPNKTVKVILQADDINNAALRNIFAAHGVAIEGEAKALNMLVLDLPVRAAE